MATRREELAEALEAIDTQVVETTPAEAPAVLETVVAPAVETTPAEGAEETRVRDEAGRFKPKAPAAPNPDAVAGEGGAKPAIAAQAPPVDRPEPPKSWKPEMRETWAKLDPETAKYLHQREEEQARGFAEYRAKVEPLQQQIEPFVQELRQRGLQPEAIARDLFYTHKLLATGDEATKLQTIVNVAHAVGIPLAQMLQASPAAANLMQHLDPTVMQAQQRARDLENQMRMTQVQQQQLSMQEAQSRIDAFAATHPHLQALEGEMTRLIQAGLATDLDSAYSKALRLNDDLFQKDQARQREAAEKERRIQADKAAKAAKASRVSTPSSTPGAQAAGTTGAPKGRRAALEESFEQLTATRI